MPSIQPRWMPAAMDKHFRKITSLTDWPPQPNIFNYCKPQQQSYDLPFVPSLSRIWLSKTDRLSAFICMIHLFLLQFGLHWAVAWLDLVCTEMVHWLSYCQLVGGVLEPVSLLLASAMALRLPWYQQMMAASLVLYNTQVSHKIRGIVISFACIT